VSIDDFTLAAKKNFAAFRENPYYVLGVRALDELYQAALRAVPGEGFPHFIGRLLLICHKSMVSGANLIATCTPEDSVGITRRALEAAKLANAIRLHDQNAKAWLAEDERHMRWITRQEGGKPKALHIRYEELKGDALSATLDSFIGILSDAYLHFTPEFYATLAWEAIQQPNGPGGFVHLSYFQPNVQELERHFTVLFVVHGRILDVFDACYDGAFSKQEEYQRRHAAFWTAAKRLNVEYREKYGQPAAPDEAAV
jgi:hypothetical protein